MPRAGGPPTLTHGTAEREAPLPEHRRRPFPDRPMPRPDRPRGLSLARWQPLLVLLLLFVPAAEVEGTAPAADTVPAGAPDASTPGADPFAGVRDTIEALRSRRRIASVAVAAAKDGRVVWEEAFGWANRAERIEATPHTPYSLASISKPITATALLILAQRGAVDLERPVDEYLPRAELTGHGGDPEEATLRRVLSHTGGLPLHYHFFYENEDHVPPPREETIRRYGFLSGPPGGAFHYSNLGYGILDHVVARVSGEAYRDFVRTEVLLPLGMTRSAVGLPPELALHAAIRYDGSQRPIPHYRFDHPGASAVWASAHDLIRFGLFHLGHDPPGAANPALSLEARRAMQRRETPEGGAGYGLGWFVDAEYGLRRVWHSGSMPGVSTMLALYPELDLAVVVLMNNLARDLRVPLTQEIAAAASPEFARARARARERAAARSAQEGHGAEGETAAPALPDGLQGRWSGLLRTWQEDLPMTLTVEADGDVHVRVDDQLPAVLEGARFRDGRLQGRYGGTIPTEDALRRPLHTVFLDLRLDGKRLLGEASAQTRGDPTHYSLASFVELVRDDPPR